MSTKIEGGCQCGAVRYTSEAEPQVVFDCHCTHCQQASGAPYTTAVAISRDDFSVTGETIEHTLTSDRGTPVHRHSCAICGAYVFGYSEGFNAAGINAVTMDDASWIKPQMIVYTQSKQPWVQLDPDLPKFEQLPPMEQG